MKMMDHVLMLKIVLVYVMGIHMKMNVVYVIMILLTIVSKIVRVNGVVML